RADTAQTPTDTPAAPALDRAAEPDRASNILPAEEPSEPPAIFTAPEEEPPVVAAAFEATSSEPMLARAPRGLSLLPILTIAGLIAIIAVGGYFLFIADDNDAPS